MSDNLDIEAIRARVEAATPGPWARDAAVVFIDGERIKVLASCAVRLWGDGTVGSAISDAEFIAHSREDIPALLSRVAELEAGLAPFCTSDILRMLDGFPDDSEAFEFTVVTCGQVRRAAALLNGTQQGSESEEVQGG